MKNKMKKHLKFRIFGGKMTEQHKKPHIYKITMI